MYRRMKPGRFHSYPEHEPMLPLGWWHRLLWKLGFDPLSDGRRVKQLLVERDDWKRWLAESEAERYRLAPEAPDSDRYAE